jgi:hypothetical protein
MRLALPGTSSLFHPLPEQMGHSAADCGDKAEAMISAYENSINPATKPSNSAGRTQVVHKILTAVAQIVSRTRRSEPLNLLGKARTPIVTPRYTMRHPERSASTTFFAYEL